MTESRGNGGMPRHAERPQVCGRSVIRDCPDWFLRYKGGFIGGGISMGAAGFSGDSTGSDMLLGATGFSMYFFGSVSYTHLRAHETRHDLVCRLLLEKKKQKQKKNKMNHNKI